MRPSAARRRAAVDPPGLLVAGCPGHAPRPVRATSCATRPLPRACLVSGGPPQGSASGRAPGASAPGLPSARSAHAPRPACRCQRTAARAPARSRCRRRSSSSMTERPPARRRRLRLPPAALRPRQGAGGGRHAAHHRAARPRLPFAQRHPGGGCEARRPPPARPQHRVCGGRHRPAGQPHRAGAAEAGPARAGGVPQC